MPPSRPSTAPMIPCKSTKSPPERGTTKSHVSSAYRNRSAIVPAEKIITTVERQSQYSHSAVTVQSSRTCRARTGTEAPSCPLRTVQQ
eukprot:640609-Pyramimonas_sp.AAC.1